MSFTERYGALLVNVIAGTVIARLLTPLDIGLFSVVYAIVNIAQNFRDLGILNYLVQEEELTRLRLRTAFGLSVATGSVATVVFLGLADPLARFFHEPRMHDVVWVLSLSFLGVSIGAIGLGRLRRAMNFGAMMRIGICQAVVHAGSSVTLASLGYGPLSLAWASVLGIWVGALGPYVYFPRDLRMLPSLRDCRRILGFGVFASGASLLQELSARAPDVIVGRLLGFAEAGFYSRGNGLITLLDQALMGAVNAVAASALAAAHRSGQDAGRLFLRFLGSTTAAAWPCLAMMGVLALPMIRLFFGDQWVPAVPVARILCAGAGFLIVAQLGGVLLLACGAARRMLIVQAVSVPLQLALTAAGSLVSIEVAAAGFGLANVVAAGMALHQIDGLIGPLLPAMARELGTSALITIVSLIVPVGVLLFYGITRESLWLPSLIAGLGGAAAWAGCVFLLGHPLAGEIELLLAKLGLSQCPADQRS